MVVDGQQHADGPAVQVPDPGPNFFAEQDPDWTPPPIPDEHDNHPGMHVGLPPHTAIQHCTVADPVVYQGAPFDNWDAPPPIAIHTTANPTVRNLEPAEFNRLCSYYCRRTYIAGVGLEANAGPQLVLHAHALGQFPVNYLSAGDGRAQARRLTTVMKRVLRWRSATEAHPLHTWQQYNGVWWWACGNGAVRSKLCDTEDYIQNVLNYIRKTMGHVQHRFWGLNLDQAEHEQAVQVAQLAGNAVYDFQGSYLSTQNLFKTVWRWYAERADHAMFSLDRGAEVFYVIARMLETGNYRLSSEFLWRPINGEQLRAAWVIVYRNHKMHSLGLGMPDYDQWCVGPALVQMAMTGYALPRPWDAGEMQGYAFGQRTQELFTAARLGMNHVVQPPFAFNNRLRHPAHNMYVQNDV